MVPTVTQHLKDNSHATGPIIQWGENMTQGMAPILKPALVGSTAGNLAKELVGQLLGEASC